MRLSPRLNARKHKLANRSKGKLTYHQRRRNLRPQVMGGPGSCPHSLAVHQDLNGQTITFALPCTVKQHKAKTPTHKTSDGRKWQ